VESVVKGVVPFFIRTGLKSETYQFHIMYRAHGDEFISVLGLYLWCWEVGHSGAQSAKIGKKFHLRSMCLTWCTSMYLKITIIVFAHVQAHKVGLLPDIHANLPLPCVCWRGDLQYQIVTFFRITEVIFWRWQRDHHSEMSNSDEYDSTRITSCQNSKNYMPAMVGSCSKRGKSAKN